MRNVDRTKWIYAGDSAIQVELVKRFRFYKVDGKEEVEICFTDGTSFYVTEQEDVDNLAEEVSELVMNHDYSTD